MLEQDEYSFCRPYLINGEYILWKGRPAEGNLLTASDIFLIPFSVMWCGFAVFWTVTALASGAPVFFGLFGVPFVCVGLYIVFGRFIWTAWIRKRTRYVITNKKIIRARGKRVDMMHGKSMPPMQMTIHKNGTGTIYFAAMNPYYRGNGNMMLNSSWPGTGVFQLENVTDLAQVQQAIETMEK